MNSFIALQNRLKRRAYFSEVRWLILLFQLMSMSLVLLHSVQKLNRNVVLFALILMLFTYVTNILVNRFTAGDNYMILICNMLFSIGVIMIYRIRPFYGQRQLLFYALGIAAFFATYYFLRFTGRFWENKAFFFLGVSVLLLVVTLLFGKTVRGATNWIQVAGFQFQPSEFTKITFAFFIAAFYANHQYFKEKLFGSVFLMAATYGLIGIFFLQGEIGTAVLFYAAMICAFIAFDKDKMLTALNILLAFAGLYLAYKLFGHIRVRFDIWLDPWSDVDGKGYQIVQSLFAVASGGLFGTGIGLGSPQSIPLSFSDFIFASIIEEMGIFMGISVILLYLIFFYRGLKISLYQKNRFYKVIALVISMIFAAQAMIVMAGVLKVIPLTGMVLPFMAYGGSSLLTSFVMMGVLQYCSEDYASEVEHEEL